MHCLRACPVSSILLGQPGQAARSQAVGMQKEQGIGLWRKGLWKAWKEIGESSMFQTARREAEA